MTGIAGPGGGTDEKPVGLVWFGLADRKGLMRSEQHIFADKGRQFIRAETTKTALKLLLTYLERD